MRRCVCARAHRRHSTTNVWMKIIHKVLRTDAACLPGSQRNSLNGTKWVHRKNKPIRLSKRRAVALSLYMVFMRTTVWIVCDVCANDRATIAFQWKLFVYLWVCGLCTLCAYRLNRVPWICCTVCRSGSPTTPYLFDSDAMDFIGATQYPYLHHSLRYINSCRCVFRKWCVLFRSHPSRRVAAVATAVAATGKGTNEKYIKMQWMEIDKILYKEHCVEWLKESQHTWKKSKQHQMRANK